MTTAVPGGRSGHRSVKSGHMGRPWQWRQETVLLVSIQFTLQLIVKGCIGSY